MRLRGAGGVPQHVAAEAGARAHAHAIETRPKTGTACRQGRETDRVAAPQFGGDFETINRHITTKHAIRGYIHIHEDRNKRAGTVRRCRVGPPPVAWQQEVSRAVSHSPSRAMVDLGRLRQVLRADTCCEVRHRVAARRRL